MSKFLLLIFLAVPGWVGAAAVDRVESQFKANYYYVRSLQALREGRMAEAADFLAAAADQDPGSLQLQLELADLCQGLGRSQDALLALQRASRIKPGDAVLKLRLAAGWIDLDQPQRAREVYEAILSQDPVSNQALRALAALDLDEGHPALARERLQKVLKADPASIPARMQLAQVYLRESRPDLAKGEYKAVLSREPAYENAYYQWGGWLETQGRFKEACQEYRRGLARTGHNRLLSSALGHALYRQGLFAEAEGVLTVLIEGAEGDPVDTYTRALCRLQLDKNLEAEQDFARLDDATLPVKGSRDYGLGLAQSAQKHYIEAEASFLKALKVNPHSLSLYAQLASLYQNTSRTARAIEMLRGGMEKNPKLQELPSLLASAYVEVHDFDRAENTLQKALSLGGGTGLRFQLAVVLDKAGKPERAESELKKILEIDPKQAEALNYLGYTWADKGVHLPEAEALLRRAIVLEPANPYFQDSLGWVCHKQARSKEALQWLRKAVLSLKEKDGPGAAVILEHLKIVEGKIAEPQTSGSR